MGKSIFMKLFICILLTVIVLSSFGLPLSQAASLGEVFSKGKEFLKNGNSINSTLNTTELENTSDYIYNTLLGIAIMVAIIVAMILGIQFMAASADEKAKVKEALMPFVVGCIVVFGAFTIWKIAVNIGNDAENNIGIKSQTQHSTGISGYKCNYSGKDIGDISSGVIVGRRDYNCPECNKKIVTAGTITGATKQIKLT